MENKPVEWENEFDYLTSFLISQESLLDIKKLRSFIHSLILKERAEEREEIEAELMPILTEIEMMTRLLKKKKQN